MNELPLSKFAPFSKESAVFQWNVKNKLNDLNINCENCIYFNNKKEDNTFYSCKILDPLENYIKENSFCRFFTNLTEIKSEEYEEDKIKEEENEDSSFIKKMSSSIKELNFFSTEIKTDIKNLRDKLINDK